VAHHDEAPADPRVHGARRAYHVDHVAAFGDADEIRVHAGRALAFVIGLHDRVPVRDVAVEQCVDGSEIPVLRCRRVVE
jgi:hypothetical protein